MTHIVGLFTPTFKYSNHITYPTKSLKVVVDGLKADDIFTVHSDMFNKNKD